MSIGKYEIRLYSFVMLAVYVATKIAPQLPNPLNVFILKVGGNSGFNVAQNSPFYRAAFQAGNHKATIIFRRLIVLPR